MRLMHDISLTLHDAFMQLAKPASAGPR